MRPLFVETIPSPLNLDLLTEELETALPGKTSGASTAPGKLWINMLPDTNALDDATALTTVAAHDGAQLSTTQQQRAGDDAAKAEVDRTKVQAALDAIDAEIATIDGTPTNADLIAIIRAMDVRQRKIIKALAPLVSN